MTPSADVVNGNGSHAGETVPGIAIKRAMPEVEIEIGGKKRVLLFNFRAYMKLEEITGKSALDGAIFETKTLKELVQLLWAGLVVKDPEITIDQVADMLSFEDLELIAKSVQEAIVRTQPAASQKKRKAPSQTNA